MVFDVHGKATCDYKEVEALLNKAKEDNVNASFILHSDHVYSGVMLIYVLRLKSRDGQFRIIYYSRIF